MITIINKHHKKPAEPGVHRFYIGRGSALGNPYTHLKSTLPGTIQVASREEAIKKYEGYLQEQYENGNKTIITTLSNIFDAAQKGDVELECFCAPHRCHGEVIKELIEVNLNQGGKSG